MEYASTSPVFLSHKDSVKAKFARHQYSNCPRTSIGSDVWIGENALVKAGVNIGHGAVVGMGSVVTRDVAPFEIVAGNPARYIRSRFDADVARALTQLRWWDFDDDDLVEFGRFMTEPRELLIRFGLL